MQENDGTQNTSDSDKSINIIGHELKNYLAVFVNVSYLLKHLMNQKGLLTPESKTVQHFNYMNAAIKSMDMVIENMLIFSRKKLSMCTEANINEIIEDSVKDILIPQKISLNLELSAGPVKIKAEPKEIKQCLKNLIVNAIDSTAGRESGKITITAKVEPEAKHAVVSVKDNGCGIPQENFSKIFEPFFTGKTKGTGLGLTVVKKVVEERHGGKCEVKSAVNEGSEFIIKLPLCR